MKKIEDYIFIVIYLLIGGIIGFFLDMLLEVDFLKYLGLFVGSSLFFRRLEIDKKKDQESDN